MSAGDRKGSTAVDTTYGHGGNTPIPAATVPKSVPKMKDDEGLGLPKEYLDQLKRLNGQTVMVTGGCGFVGTSSNPDPSAAATSDFAAALHCTAIHCTALHRSSHRLSIVMRWCNGASV